MKNRILLLEDDVSLIDGLQYSLKKNGFDVDFVRSVQETLTYLPEILDHYGPKTIGHLHLIDLYAISALSLHGPFHKP